MRYLFEDCVFDTGRRELHRGADTVSLAPQVFDLLAHLIQNRERVVSKDDLVAAIWGGRIVSDAAVTTRINAARAAVGDSGEEQRLIKTLPRKGFRFVGAVREEQGPVGTPSVGGSADPSRPTLAPPDKPSIAVMPFDNLGSDPEQSYFAEGMAEDLITSLSYIRWLTVIGRSSSFSYKGRSVDPRQIGSELSVRYLLEGSVRKALGRVRITVKLTDAESGTHLWGDKFDGQIEDIFDLQDRIAASVIGAIEPSLRGAEIARAQRKRPDSLGAYDLYLQALPHAYAHTREGRTAALDLLDKALAIKPDYAEAHGLAAWCHLQRFISESPDLSAALAGSLTHARAVMAIGTDDASTLAFASMSYARGTGDYEAALQMIDHALASNPSNAHALAYGAVLNGWVGRFELAIGLAERALRCSPFDPLRHLALAITARARLVQGDAEAALVAARRAVQATPGHLPSHGYVLICLVRLGRTQELETALERMRAGFPGVRLAHFTAHPMFGLFGAELKAVGLPD
jgi:TolB-like protein